MLGRYPIVKYDTQLRLTHIFVEPHYSEDFHSTMRANGIIAERVSDAEPRHCFRVVNPQQAATMDALCAQWQRHGYVRSHNHDEFAAR